MTVIRPLRADAERNRQRILDAATELFAERGVDVSVEDSAARACVGIGTFYRRFPDRETLVEAVFANKLDRILELAEAARAIEDPGEAFRTFVVTIARMHAQDRGLKDVTLSQDRGRERVAQFRSRIQPIGLELLDRAKAAGAVRQDLSPFDVPMIHRAVSAIAELTREVSPEYFERTLTLLIDGLMADRPPTPMLAPPLEPEQVTEIMSRKHAR
jgi:AcrR family transcriptional regulator